MVRMMAAGEVLTALSPAHRSALRQLVEEYDKTVLRASNLHNAMLDGAEKEYLLDKKCNELRAGIASRDTEIKELREGIEYYTEPWVKVGTERTGPVLASTYNDDKGGCDDKWIPEGIEVGIYEPPKVIKGLKNFKALRHLKAANKIRDERNGHVQTTETP